MALLRQCLNDVRLRQGEATVADAPQSRARSDAADAGHNPSGRPLGGQDPSTLCLEETLVQGPLLRLH